ncbi:MAG: PqqD family protein [Clostridia bacterium]|nr:PqqD family protein [Clostridia bacterium]MBN2882184.1 PqqD family protein [Clostridia bacterium]
MKLSANIILRDMQGETVLLNLETGDYYSLNQVGSLIIKCIEENLSVDEITAKVLDTYDIDEETAKSDVLSLIDDLVKNNILEV